jgi:hypothetical protein
MTEGGRLVQWKEEWIEKKNHLVIGQIKHVLIMGGRRVSEEGKRPQRPEPIHKVKDKGWSLLQVSKVVRVTT